MQSAHRMYGSHVESTCYKKFKLITWLAGVAVISRPGTKQSNLRTKQQSTLQHRLSQTNHKIVLNCWENNNHADAMTAFTTTNQDAHAGPLIACEISDISVINSSWKLHHSHCQMLKQYYKYSHRSFHREQQCPSGRMCSRCWNQVIPIGKCLHLHPLHIVEVVRANPFIPWKSVNTIRQELEVWNTAPRRVRREATGYLWKRKQQMKVKHKV